MIDLHSHLLPNLDDGSRSVEQSAEVLEAFVAVGVTDVVLTPHLRAGEIPSQGERAIAERDHAMEELIEAVPAGMRLHPGFEIMLDEPLPEIAMGDRRYGLAGSRHYLVEFPFIIVGDLATTILGKIAAGGIVPMVAHPERYSCCSVSVVEGWREAGALIQVDANTLTRSSARGQRARALVEAGLADVLAADNHGDRRTLGAGAAFLEARGARRAARLLTLENPRAVIDDGAVGPVPSVRLRLGLIERVREWMR